MDCLPNIIMYTDGACSGNPGPGGWGVYLIRHDSEHTLQGAELLTTNNRMELTAVIQGLKSLDTKCRIQVYTDSTYVKLGITNWIQTWIKKEWRNSQNKPVKNIDLWHNLHYQTNLHIIEWFWVKGHSNNYGNNIADKLAVEALKKIKYE